jgi:hypothetical protein
MSQGNEQIEFLDEQLGVSVEYCKKQHHEATCFQSDFSGNSMQRKQCVK